MQQQKLESFILIYPGYSTVQFGIYKNNDLVRSIVLDNKEISKNISFVLEELLSAALILFQDLDFIGCVIGPAPYTTLRSCLGFINGVSFVKNLKLLPLNSLEILFNKYNKENSVALFNAFSDDVYFVSQNETGCKKNSSIA